MPVIVGNPFLCHCEEDASPTRQSIVSRGDAYVLSLRSLDNSGSPRAYALAMTTHSLSLRGVNEVIDAAIHCMQWGRTDNTVRSLDHSGSRRASPSR
ncbi:hypothetical protein N8920_01370 [Opitutales bacterium]|nr:hypothetical protein [Opitutales bacterium]